MSCPLCLHRPGWSGYVIPMEGGGWKHMPCRCEVAERDRDLYGHTRNKLLMLRYLGPSLTR